MRRLVSSPSLSILYIQEPSFIPLSPSGPSQEIYVHGPLTNSFGILRTKVCSGENRDIRLFTKEIKKFLFFLKSATLTSIFLLIT
jgi:hypothetical protein